MSTNRLRSRVVLLLLATVCLLPAATRAQDAHMLWHVTGGDGQTAGYLTGSVHVMKEDAYPLAPVFDDAFADTDRLAFEANLDSMEAKAQQLVGQLAVYPQGQTLESELSPETYAALEARMEKLGMPLAQLQRLEPWMVSIMVPAVQMQQAGYAQNQGIDKYFFDKAKEAGKPTTAFETAEEQLGFFDRLAPEKQEAYLMYSLEEADRTVENIDTMVRYWKNGDAEALADLLAGQMQAEAPELYDVLIAQRNERWMPQITEMLDGEGRPMIVVGAGHLVGPDGLVEMLRADGYRVEQL